MEMWVVLVVGFSLILAWIEEHDRMLVNAESEPIGALGDPLQEEQVLQEFKQWDQQLDGASQLKRSRMPRNINGWKRRALNAIDKIEIMARNNNCSVGPLAVVGELASQNFQKQFLPQIQTLSKFVIFLQNLLNSMAVVDVPDEDVHSGGDNLYASFTRSIVQSDSAIYGCALYIENKDQDPEGFISLSASSSLPRNSLTVAYRNGTDQEICIVKHPGVRMHSDVPNTNQGNASSPVYPPSSSCEELATATDNSQPFLVQIVNTYKKQLGNLSKVDRVNASSFFRGNWSAPWYICNHTTWTTAYSLPIFSKQRWRGVIMITFDLKAIDVNQCAQRDGLFGDTHLCHRETMQCIHHAGKGFHRGTYSCACQPGYYFPTSNDSRTIGAYFNGSLLEGTFAEESQIENLENLYQDFRCLPCRSGCYECTDPSPCFIDYDVLWRSAPLGLQSFCMTITVVLGICVFRLRKCKVIAAGMWTVLEMILVGAILLYSTVVIRYFEPLTLGCLLEPWFREMGFAICYGTIILKMYRILVEFRTRKAHRWVIRDKDLLKYLAGIILVVMGYMSAWTAISVDHIREGDSVIDLGETEDKLKFYICKSRWWDYVTEVGEMSFLLFGIYISYHIRNATSPYKEKRYLCLAIYIEALVSLLLYVFRHHVWLTLHPDYIFLMYFARCQFTVSITLLLIFGPKLWYHYKPPHEGEGDHGRTAGEGQDHVAPEVLKLQDGITSNGEVDIGEINLADMDPEDIRSELRRVYTQLQVLRNKTMRKDNPHISKRRGGRKATHRRFSLQAFHRHRHHHDQDHETDISKTPEESTGSVDAGAQASDVTNEATSGSNVSGARKGAPIQ